MTKRILDISGAVVVLALFSPVMLVVAFLVFLTLGRPIIFRQQRPGLNQRLFWLAKFRTMTGTPDEFGRPRPDSERLTPFGRFLRSTSLDELPELFNVLRGDMSLVGPRPLLMEYLSLYSKRHARRHEVRPGLTGWAQVNGRNALSWEERLDLDVWYVENQSLVLDLRILMRTVAIVLTRRGISAPGEATMPNFTGTGRGAGTSD